MRPAWLLVGILAVGCGVAGTKLPAHRDLGAYPAGLVTARLVAEGTCVFAESPAGDQRWLAIWPTGFSLDGQRLLRNGAVVASIGDVVNLGGGEYTAGQVDFVQTLLDEPVPDACGGGYWLVTGIGEATAGNPTPPTEAIEIPTFASEGLVPPSPCPSTVLEGTLGADDRSGVIVRDSGGRAIRVIWPTGAFARSSIGGMLLLDGTGSLVAATGDQLRIEGTASGVDGWLACGRIERLGQS